MGVAILMPALKIREVPSTTFGPGPTDLAVAHCSCGISRIGGLGFMVQGLRGRRLSGLVFKISTEITYVQTQPRLLHIGTAKAPRANLCQP